MQLQVGTFRFEVGQAEYQELIRTRARRWAERERHGRPPEVENLGREAERITLSGTVWVSVPEDLAALDDLVSEAGLAAQGQARTQPVYLGGGSGSSGEYLGMWAVPRLEVTERQLRHDGIPTEIDFEVELLEVVA